MSTDPSLGPNNDPSTPDWLKQVLSIIEKIVEKLPMKFTSRQSYCILAAIILFLIALTFMGTGWHVGNFPSGNDLRLYSLAIILALAYGAIFGEKKKK